MAQENQPHVTQTASPTPISTHADQLLARLARHKQTTNKPTRFFIPSGSVALLEFYKGIAEERNSIFENDDSVNISIKRIGEWIENPKILHYFGLFGGFRPPCRHRSSIVQLFLYCEINLMIRQYFRFYHVFQDSSSSTFAHIHHF